MLLQEKEPNNGGREFDSFRQTPHWHISVYISPTHVKYSGTVRIKLTSNSMYANPVYGGSHTKRERLDDCMSEGRGDLQKRTV